MKPPVNLVLSALLSLNALLFTTGAIAQWTFEQWIVPDIFAIAVCGAIGIWKKFYSLQAVVGVIVFGMLVRLSITLWLAADVFIIGACVYAGYFLFKKGGGSLVAREKF